MIIPSLPAAWQQPSFVNTLPRIIQFLHFYNSNITCVCSKEKNWSRSPVIFGISLLNVLCSFSSQILLFRADPAAGKPSSAFGNYALIYRRVGLIYACPGWPGAAARCERSRRRRLCATLRFRFLQWPRRFAQKLLL